MLTDYIAAALRRAHYEILPDGEGVYAEIRELPGVWANGDTVEETREDLRLALEGWIALALARGVPIPELDGVGIALTAVP
ncbi:MAG: type II toxin-antitoxin system HicB family antitoxin [Chloroflexota bacterium]|nr:type II toxin-antitoxin system HicB family antitoxin [Chloroflexota bacterium]